MNAMNQIFKVIANRRKKHESDEYIVWLYEQARNKPSIERICEIALIGAHFYLSFTDINRLAWYYPNPTDDYMRAINLHTEEDGAHYKLFIQDLKTLGFDSKFKITDVLSFIWSANNSASRDITFTMYELGKKCQHPGMKFAMIESLEQQGNMLFTAYSNLVGSITKNNDAYVFFGEKHLLLEQGHLSNQEINEHITFNGIELTSDEVNEAIDVVNATWDAFETLQASFMVTLSNFETIFSKSTRSL